MDLIKGKAFVFGNNIDTDQIYPGRYLELTEHDEIARHAMEGADPSFAGSVSADDIVVAGTNFGCGSSREHAVITLKNAKIGAVVAKSFARIFFRNAINQGLLAVEIPELDSLGITAGDIVEIDAARGILTAHGKGTIKFPPLPNHILSIIDAGGIFSLFREKGARAHGE